MLRARQKVWAPWLTVLTYHRIGNVEECGLDGGVIDATPEQFAAQLSELKRRFTMVGPSEVAAFYNEGVPLPRNAAMISFDDGYRDNREVALPALLAAGVRATFFIATSYISDRRIFWWDRIGHVVRNARTRQFRLRYPEDMDVTIGDDMKQANRLICGPIRTHVGLDIDRYLTELHAAADVPWSRAIERDLADANVMTWDDVRALKDAGMHVESHTRTHRVLQTLTPDDLREELAGSRRELENQVDARVQAIAYPTGVPIEDRPDIRAAIENAGYRVGFSAGTGVNSLRNPGDRFSVGRLWVDNGYSTSRFRAILALPSVFAD